MRAVVRWEMWIENDWKCFFISLSGVTWVVQRSVLSRKGNTPTHPRRHYLPILFNSSNSSFFINSLHQQRLSHIASTSFILHWFTSKHCPSALPWTGNSPKHLVGTRSSVCSSAWSKMPEWIQGPRAAGINQPWTWSSDYSKCGSQRLWDEVRQLYLPTFWADVKLLRESVTPLPSCKISKHAMTRKQQYSVLVRILFAQMLPSPLLRRSQMPWNLQVFRISLEIL